MYKFSLSVSASKFFVNKVLSYLLHEVMFVVGYVDVLFPFVLCVTSFLNCWASLTKYVSIIFDFISSFILWGV